MLHANFTALSLIEQELWATEVLHCGNRNFRPFWLLWPWPWPDDLRIRPWDRYCREVHGMYKYELPKPRTSKVIVWQAYIQTDKLRSRDKDAGQAIRSAVVDNPSTKGKPDGSICYETGVMGDRSLAHIVGIGMDVCGSCDPELDHRTRKYELMSRLAKVIVCQTFTHTHIHTYIHTHRQTDWLIDWVRLNVPPNTL